MANDFGLNYLGLKELIEAEEHKELQCREFLQYVKDYLVRDTVLEFIYVERERRSASGDSDYIISCRVCDETGIESVKAYIWEIKAPQCYIFKRETENRLCPTKELIEAENQLLHYHNEHRGSTSFTREFGITHPDNIFFGGIIIGCHNKRVSGTYEDRKKNILFEKALSIRKKYIYDPLNIRIMHWDYILDFLKPQSVPIKQATTEEVIHSASISQGTINSLTFSK